MLKQSVAYQHVLSESVRCLHIWLPVLQPNFIVVLEQGRY